MHLCSVSLNLNNDPPTRPLGGYALIGSDGVLHTKHRVDRNLELALFHELKQHDGVVLGRRRGEHDVAARHAAQPGGPPGVEDPVLERGARAFHGANVDDYTVRFKVRRRVNIQGLQTDAVEHKVERLRRVLRGQVGRQRVVLAVVDELFLKVSSPPSSKVLTEVHSVYSKQQKIYLVSTQPAHHLLIAPTRNTYDSRSLHLANLREHLPHRSASPIDKHAMPLLHPARARHLERRRPTPKHSCHSHHVRPLRQPGRLTARDPHILHQRASAKHHHIRDIVVRHHARPNLPHVGRGRRACGHHGAGELELGDGWRREGYHGKRLEQLLAAELQSHVRYADQNIDGGRAGERGRGVGCC